MGVWWFDFPSLKFPTSLYHVVISIFRLFVSVQLNNWKNFLVKKSLTCIVNSKQATTFFITLNIIPVRLGLSVRKILRKKDLGSFCRTIFTFVIVISFWLFSSFSVDEITIPSQQGKGQLRRVPEVFDCWFESGRFVVPLTWSIQSSFSLDERWKFKILRCGIWKNLFF